MSNVTPIGKEFQRLGAFVLDSTEIIDSYLDAITYAQSPIAVPGQILRVLKDDKNTYDAYIINKDKTLRRITDIGESGGLNYEEIQALINIHNNNLLAHPELINKINELENKLENILIIEINPSDLISSDLNNALTTGLDGNLFVDKVSVTVQNLEDIIDNETIKVNEENRLFAVSGNVIFPKFQVDNGTLYMSDGGENLSFEINQNGELELII